MRTNSTGPLVPVLLASARPFDAVEIKDLLHGTAYMLVPAFSLGQAQNLMSHIVFPIIMFDRHFAGSHWPATLAKLVSGWQTPVTLLLSEPCEAGFWEQSISRGVFDVLIRPLRSECLVPTLDLAHVHWKLGLAGGPLQAASVKAE